MAQMTLVDIITRCVDDGECVVGILDFSKAFKAVNHQILLKKFNIWYKGSRSPCQKWHQALVKLRLDIRALIQYKDYILPV